MAITIDRARVAERQQRLVAARGELKSYFIGIDGVIDDLCDSIAVWYTMPEVLTRPVIVNLWGMTGVGKTDLIRRLVAALDIQERFVEVELSNGDSTTWHTSVASRLADSPAMRGEPAMLLFDEIQRFNTIDQDGKPLTNTKFSDFWELLSDGRLSRRDNNDFDLMMASVFTSARHRRQMRERGEEVTDDTIGVWEAQSLKRSFGVSGNLEQLAEMSYDDAIAVMQTARTDKRIYEPIDCSKCLVIISGNLDEAFTMSRETAEADVDADIFHAFTSQITMVDIKRALIRRFKPEQVARFGNIHLIYTSLKRGDFEALIGREVGRVVRSTHEAFDIELTVSPAVERLIYRNGVFPVQGVRPVFSSVADVLESHVAKLLFAAILSDATEIALDYDEQSRELIGSVGSDTSRYAYSGPIDAIRVNTLPDKVANVAVHEAGHAVAYGVLFGLAPLQVTARVASTYVAGFTFPHQIYQTSQSILDQVRVLLAGGLAEEVVFGSEHASIGRVADREKATELIIDYVRRYGFDPEFQANYMLELIYAMDRSVPEPDIEKLMTRLAAETQQLLNEHRSTLIALSAQLMAEGKLDGAGVAAAMLAAGTEVAVREEGYQWTPAYEQRLADG
jgi:hypothetical protein